MLETTTRYARNVPEPIAIRGKWLTVRQNGLLNLNLNLALCDDPITIDIPITIL